MSGTMRHALAAIACSAVLAGPASLGASAVLARDSSFEESSSGNGGGLIPPQAPALGSGPVARFDFERPDAEAGVRIDGDVARIDGLVGGALRLGAAATATLRPPAEDGLRFDGADDFSIRYWVRTTADAARRMVVLAHKDFPDNSLVSQKNAGWVSYVSDGTWAWNAGTGDRRLTYERDNGALMPLNDGRWHQIAITFDRSRGEFRLYYDGRNRAIYNVDDAVGFDFSAARPLVVGWAGAAVNPEADIVPAISAGAETLQAYVDAFNALDVDDVAPDELVALIVEPERLLERKIESRANTLGDEAATFRDRMQEADFGRVTALEADLMDNPYTIHQAFSFMETAPLLKLYSLEDGRIVIDEAAARAFTERERLYPVDFDIDELAIWDRPLSAEEIRTSYAAHFEPVGAALDERITTLTAGVWNIFHGGKHFTIDEHGWDSRRAIAEILRRRGVDVVMMQETYSSGDFIAAELGYYYATTVDRDYLNQGANISVLSRYPIEEVYVDPDSPFMTVAAKIAVSNTQQIYAMSNWYGMDQFPSVFAFNEGRFAESDAVPVLFGGDFNAVPHTDGGDSPASRALLDAGFVDAYRSTFPDVDSYPGATHRSGRRIDQLYYKGRALRNTSTELIATWPTGFPSDHYLIVATFEWTR